MPDHKNIPNLFIIGAPKCGTSSLFSYLGKHPNVFVSKVKEPHYFNTDSKHRYYFSKKRYLNLFSKAKASQAYLCEASVWYLYSNTAIDEILTFNPEAKFIIMLRNPVEMYFSLHQELLFGGTEKEKSPLRAWNLQESRKNGKDIPKGCSAEELLQYGEVCKLGVQSMRATNKISEENLKFVLLDDLKKAPNKTYLDVLTFLKISHLTLDDYPIINPRKARKYYWLSNLFSAITRVKKEIGITKGFGITTRLNQLNKSRSLDIDTKEKEKLIVLLFNYFKDDVSLLEQTIKVDLSHWKNIKNIA